MSYDRTTTRRGLGRPAARLAGVAAVMLLAAAALPASGSAARGLVTGLEGHGQYDSVDPAERSLFFNRTVEAGAGIIRYGFGWATVAPTQPADPTNPGSLSYDFSAVDRTVRSANEGGVDVMLTINQAPTWAEGPGRPSDANVGSWMPNTTAVADFFQAVAARYSGNFDPDGVGPQPVLPAVKAIQVWNEPNQDFWLAPQFQGKTIIGGDRYRDLLNAAYKAIKSVNPKLIVVTGGTSPYGDPPGGPYPVNGARVRPVQWWQSLLCVKPVKGKKKPKKKGKKAAPRYVRTPNCPAKPLFDVLAHQPIDNTGGGPLESGPHRYDASTPDLGRVVSVLRGAEKAGTVSGGRHPVWVTEFWWDSKPPNPSGSPLPVQARWIEQSMYLFWKAGASTAINFAIEDTSEFPTTRNGFQSGLYLAGGKPKPALTAFRFPFVTERVNARKLTAWGKSPATGQLKIQRRDGGWKTVKKLKVKKGGVFTTKLSLTGKQSLRAVVGPERSLVWKQAAGTGKKGTDDSGVFGFIDSIRWPLIGLGLLFAAGFLRRRQVLRRRRRQLSGREPVRMQGRRRARPAAS